MGRTYCHHCASKLETRDERSWWCDTCQQTYYENVAATAEAAIFNDKNELLVVIRAEEPGKGKLDLPGGFTDFDESIEEGLFRELHEELGLKREDMTEPQLVGGWCTDYAWGKDTTKIAGLTFAVRLRHPVTLKAQDDIASAEFIPLQEIDPTKFAFSRAQHGILDKIKKIATEIDL